MLYLIFFGRCPSSFTFLNHARRVASEEDLTDPNAVVLTGLMPQNSSAVLLIVRRPDIRNVNTVKLHRKKL